MDTYAPTMLPLHLLPSPIEAAQSVRADDPMHQTLRLVQMAR